MASDGWHPLGLSHAVEAGSSAGARILGRELVVWRDSGGAIHVWEDRCPHRGMKLSFGFVRGDAIACLYHGWQYDRGGICRYIPAHPDLDVPTSIKVGVYPAQERGGMIWTTFSATPAALFEDREPTLPLRSLYLDGDIPTAVAALRGIRLIPFATDGLSDTHVDRVTDTLYQVSSGQDRLLVGIQVISETRIALHLAICGWQKLYEGRGQRHFLAWALQLRDAIENPRHPSAAQHHVAARPD